MEDFYRNIYAVNGVTDIKFPEHYPVSRLLGCVEVVGCVREGELLSWEEVPESVRLEALTDFCWLCEKPQKLAVPFEMRGYQKVYNLERKIVEAATRGLCPVKGPLPVKFPLPDPHGLYAPKQRSFASTTSEVSPVHKSASLAAAISGAQAAAVQFSKKNQTGSSRAVHARSFHSYADKSKEIHPGKSATTIYPSFSQNGSTKWKEVDPNRTRTVVCSISQHSGSTNSKKVNDIEISTEYNKSSRGPSNARHNSSHSSDMYLDHRCWDGKCKASPVLQFGEVAGSHFRAPSKQQWRRSG